MTHSFDWAASYATPRRPVFARNIVSTSHPLAAQAGLRIIAAGGTAVDGAIAAAAVMTLVEPCSNGLGSDAFCILWDGSQLHGLNASGPAPAAWPKVSVIVPCRNESRGVEKAMSSLLAMDYPNRSFNLSACATNISSSTCKPAQNLKRIAASCNTTT